MAIPNDLSVVSIQIAVVCCHTQMASSNANTHFPIGSTNLNQPRTVKLLKVLLCITEEYFLTTIFKDTNIMHSAAI